MEIAFRFACLATICGDFFEFVEHQWRSLCDLLTAPPRRSPTDVDSVSGSVRHTIDFFSRGNRVLTVCSGAPLSNCLTLPPWFLCILFRGPFGHDLEINVQYQQMCSDQRTRRSGCSRHASPDARLASSPPAVCHVFCWKKLKSYFPGMKSKFWN